MKWTPERKVGLFTIIGMGIFIYVALFLSHISLFTPPEISIMGRFKTVTGLKQGNPVRYAGVPIGKVTKIEVSPNGVTVKMKVDSDIKIPDNSKVSLQMDGLLGEKFVSIMPGSSTHMLEDGSVIDGRGQNEMDETFNNMNRVLAEAEKLFMSMNKLVGDVKTQDALKQSVENAALITSNLVSATNQMNTLMAKNSNTISSIAINIDSLTKNLDMITKQLDNTLTTVGDNGSTAENIRDIIVNVKETSASLKAMSQNMETVLGNQQTAQDLQKTIHNAARLTTALSGVAGVGNSADMQVGMNMLYSGTNKEYDNSFDMRIKADKALFVMGANHIGNGTKIDFNAGTYFDDKLSARAGMFDGDIGIGLDYGLVKNPVTLSAVAMDPNNPRYRIRGEIKLFNGVKAIAQMNRPYDAPHGGNYYGVQYDF